LVQSPELLKDTSTAVVPAGTSNGSSTENLPHFRQGRPTGRLSN
jgi:hypothetical protein